MLLKRFIATIILGCLLIGPTKAQSTKAAQISQIASCFSDSAATGAITPAIVRTCLNSMVNSYQQFTGINAQTGTSYAIAVTDYGQLVTFNNASAVAVSLPQATGSFFPFNAYVKNLGAGLATMTPVTSTINGGASFTLAQNQSAFIVSDGVNYQVWNSATVPNSFGTQTANTVFAGPTSGGAANPAFRLLVAADYQSATIPLASLQTENANTAVCNPTGGAASPVACTQTQLTALINTVTSSLPGLVPAFPNTTTSYYRGDNSYQTHNCASNTDASVYCAALRGQLPGTTTNDNASSGNIGEYIESVIASGSAVSLTTATPKDVTTISLTAGDWDVSSSCSFILASTTSITNVACGVSQTLNTLDTTNGRQTTLSFGAVVPTAGTDYAISTIPLRFSLSGTTTIHMVAQATFTISTTTGYGIVRARRVR